MFGKVRGVCPNCGFIHFIDPKVAVVVFIEERIAEVPHVLLVQRANDPERGRWALPAGFVDRGEDPQIAAVREVGEETSLQIATVGLLGIWRDASAVIVIGYTARVIGGTLCAADDALDARWFNTDNLPPEADLGFDSTRRLLSAWQQNGTLAHLPVGGS
jgi:ADP-ribose pyrophosphatase YjhB (NUDIX family)